jgi:flagellar protein FlaF
VNNKLLAHNAYGQKTAPTRTARDTEYEVIARITHRIRTAALKGKNGFPELVAALDENRRLWTTLATDVADPKNGLPQDLRARLFYLAEYTFGHTSKVLGGKASASSLIDVNMAVMRGLRGQGAKP